MYPLGIDWEVGNQFGNYCAALRDDGGTGSFVSNLCIEDICDQVADDFELFGSAAAKTECNT